MILCLVVTAMALLSCRRAEPASPGANGPATSASVIAPAGPERFEYITFAPPDDVYDETLNRLGGEGWELVTSRRVRASYGDMAYEITMRRKVRAGAVATTGQEQELIAIRSMLAKRPTEPEPEKQVEPPKADAKTRSAAFAAEARERTRAEIARGALHQPDATRASVNIPRVFLDMDNMVYHEATCEVVKHKRMLSAVVYAAKMQGLAPAADCHRPIPP